MFSAYLFLPLLSPFLPTTSSIGCQSVQQRLPFASGDITIQNTRQKRRLTMQQVALSGHGASSHYRPAKIQWLARAKEIGGVTRW